MYAGNTFTGLAHIDITYNAVLAMNTDAKLPYSTVYCNRHVRLTRLNKFGEWEILDSFF